MVPRKRKEPTKTNDKQQPQPFPKRVTRIDRESIICKKKIAALDQEESVSNEDRFTFAEKEQLLEAYYANGFKIFHDIKLLQQYFPNRRENDLKGLLERLSHGLQVSETSNFNAIDEWQRICQNLVGNFTRDKKVSLDEILADSLIQVSEKFKDHNDIPGETSSQNNQPDYHRLLRDMSELLRGQFPENTMPVNAAISMNLYEHINDLVNSVDATISLDRLLDGSWLKSATNSNQRRHESAQKGIEDLGKTNKKCPTYRDFTKNPNVEALCLELPKIKRIAEILNPLHLDETIGRDLLDN